MSSRQSAKHFTHAGKKPLRNRVIKVSLLYLICLPVIALLFGFELLIAPVQTALATCTGAVNFSSPTAFSTAGNVNAVAVGDFNNDGKLDIIAVNKAPSNNLSLLLGNGNGGFSTASGSPISSGIGNNPFALATGDFNND